MENERINRGKNEFLERMSREIHAPLNSIIGLSYLSKENVGNTKQLLENLEKIDMSAHFILSFVNDILNLSQLESGSVAENRDDTDLKKFLEELSRGIENKAREKQIDFSMKLSTKLSGANFGESSKESSKEDFAGDFMEKPVETHTGFGRKYRFDAQMLGKALFNILDNAVKFTPSEGKVEFIVEMLKETDQDAAFRFQIRDNGIGMDETFLPRAFDPLEQEDSGSPTLGGGTGLGLAIARNIIRVMNGNIEVHSKKGNGSTFIINVTLDKAADGGKDTCGQSRGTKQDYDFTGKRVLLVEDNEINVEITGNILRHKNFDVEVAVNGREGVEMFLAHAPGYYDVILMDIRMPEMDGLTATQKIRGSDHADSERIPIIAMTANAFEEDVRKSFQAGMNEHLSKPVDIKQMYSMLDGMIYG